MYARKIRESEMFGFLEIEDFVFGENTTLVIDPAEERLQLEFCDVKRTFVPLQSVFRIDEVVKAGVAKIREKSSDGKITMFPISGKHKE